MGSWFVVPVVIPMALLVRVGAYAVLRVLS
jgi:hypothetical protein